MPVVNWFHFLSSPTDSGVSFELRYKGVNGYRL